MVLLVNKKAGECITATNNGNGNWWGWKSTSCSPGNNDQELEIIDAGVNDRPITNKRKTANNYLIRLKNKTDTYMTVSLAGDANNDFAGPDDVRAWGFNETSGQSREGNFEFHSTYSERNGKDAIANGPFKIRTKWEPYNFRDRRLTFEDADGFTGERLRNWPNANGPGDGDGQMFLEYSLWKTCKERGISFDDCTKDNLNNCDDPKNQNSFEACPDKYCNADRMGEQRCRDYCKSKGGDCDVRVTQFCSKNPTHEFCSCFGEMTTDVAKKLAAQGIITTKVCNDIKCVANEKAYKTKDMINKTCSPITACIQGIEVGSIGGKADLSGVTFSCSQTTTPASAPSKTTTPTKTDDEEDEDEPKKKKDTTQPINYTLIAIVAAIIFIIILLMLL